MAINAGRGTALALDEQLNQVNVVRRILNYRLGTPWTDRGPDWDT